MKRIIACILFAVGLITLLGLGTWQYQRLQWKNSLIADLDGQYNALPMKSAVLSRTRMMEAAQLQERPFLVDKISGRLLGDKTIFMGPRSINGQSGYDVITPVSIDDGVVLAHLGWVKETDRARLSFPRGMIMMHGIARKPDHSRFAGGNSPENDLWFHVNIEQIAQARALNNVSPLVFFAYDITPPIEALRIANTRWYPRNKHAQYMLFWYGMALAWIAVFMLAYRRSRA